jgi:hypothetical protein
MLDALQDFLVTHVSRWSENLHGCHFSLFDYPSDEGGSCPGALSEARHDDWCLP